MYFSVSTYGQLIAAVEGIRQENRTPTLPEATNLLGQIDHVRAMLDMDFTVAKTLNDTGAGAALLKMAGELGEVKSLLMHLKVCLEDLEVIREEKQKVELGRKMNSSGWGYQTSAWGDPKTAKA